MEDEVWVTGDNMADEVWTANNKGWYNTYDEKNGFVKIKNGLKIVCRESIYNNLISNTELQKDFQLNVKRLNRWYWSIYFKDLRTL